MAFKFSTGSRNKVLDNSSLKGLLDGGLIKIYSGTVPATADSALGGASLLVTISDNGTGAGLNLDASAADGVITKDLSQVWKGVNGASGTASFFRFVQQADTGGESTTEVRVQGVVGLAGADMNLSSVVLASTEEQLIDYFSIAFSTL
jgi:hypothetical protein